MIRQNKGFRVLTIMDHHIWSPSILLLDLSKPLGDFLRVGKITLDVEVGRVERGKGTTADESDLVALRSKANHCCCVVLVKIKLYTMP